MRTTDYALDLTLAGKPAASRLSGLMSAVKAVWRLTRNRRAIGSLEDLDDHQLLDMGLHREDIHKALTTSLFASPGHYLTDAVRKRTGTFYRNARRD